MGYETPKVLADKIVDIMKTDENWNGLFLHPVSRQHQHLCFTGGEPLMPSSQLASVGIYRELEERSNLPASMTFETNGTQKLTDTFKNGNTKKFYVSPTVYSIGEKRKAIKSEIVLA